MLRADSHNDCSISDLMYAPNLQPDSDPGLSFAFYRLELSDKQYIDNSFDYKYDCLL